MSDTVDETVRFPDDGTVELTLAADNSSVPIARHFVTERWADLTEDVLGDVELIVAELVANAVRHGEPEVVLRLRKAPFAIDVAVLDHGPGWPVRRSADEVRDLGHGRGLSIVDRLAAAWGASPVEDGQGKVVWASIDRV